MTLLLFVPTTLAFTVCSIERIGIGIGILLKIIP